MELLDLILLTALPNHIIESLYSNKIIKLQNSLEALHRTNSLIRFNRRCHQIKIIFSERDNTGQIVKANHLQKRIVKKISFNNRYSSYFWIDILLTL